MKTEPLENGIRIMQSDKGHRFGNEAVLLVSFSHKAAAKGKYLDGVDDKKLKFVMKMAAKLFCGKFYRIFARVCKAFYKL